MRQIPCAESGRYRSGAIPISSITNYIGGEVLNPELPPITATTWGDRTTKEPILRDELDADGCRHYLYEPEEDRFGAPPPSCWCFDCQPPGPLSHMILCPDCGNKRCPKATNHDHDCTGSNEPGQEGSRYV